MRRICCIIIIQSSIPAKTGTKDSLIMLSDYQGNVCAVVEDPLAENHPDQSPYLHCAGNPVNYIDPDGRNGIRIVDFERKLITIKANYYVVTESLYYRDEGQLKEFKGYSAKDIEKMNGYNEYLNSLNLEVTSGEYEGFKMNFDLSFIDGGNSGSAKSMADGAYIEEHNIGNIIERCNNKINKNLNFAPIENPDGTTSEVGGVTDMNRIIVMNPLHDNKMNRLHEIFHTLGLSHPPTGGTQGIMKYPPSRPSKKDALELSKMKFLPTIKK